MLKKIGRNDPCICGSGKKYKKCCLTNRRLPISNKAIQESQERLKTAVKKQLGSKAIILENALKLKMSEIILDIVEDFVHDADSENELRNIIMATCFGWNLSLLPPKKRAKEIKKFMDGFINLDAENYDLLTSFLEVVIERKQDFYPDINRLILNYEIIGGPGNFYLNVITVLDPDEIELTKIESIESD